MLGRAKQISCEPTDTLVCTNTPIIQTTSDGVPPLGDIVPPTPLLLGNAVSGTRRSQSQAAVSVKTSGTRTYRRDAAKFRLERGDEGSMIKDDDPGLSALFPETVISGP